MTEDEPLGEAAVTLRAASERGPEHALALLALTLAHETKNALNPLGLQLALLRRRIAPDPTTAGLLDAMATAVAAADRVVTTAQQLAQVLAPDAHEDRRGFEALARALRPRAARDDP